MLMRARVMLSSPLRTSNPSGLLAMMFWIWAMLPLASFTPTIPGSSASLSMVSTLMLEPVLPGML